MSLYYGYVTLPVDSYDSFRAAIIGNAYNADYFAGFQCWDVVSEAYYNFGWGQGYPITQSGGNGQAWMCWTYSKEVNSGNGISLVYNLSDVKRGDIVVLNGTTQNPDGHITFADEDYDGSGYLWCVGQNQGGTPLPEGGTVNTRNHLGMGDFLGAFRYDAWQPTPPTPTVTKKRFPWVLYARKFRERRAS